jgi:hypothetical protein
MPTIIEQHLLSKAGTPDGGDDRLVTGPHAYGVIDGATDRSGLNWSAEPGGFRSGGSAAADVIQAVLATMGPSTEPPELVDRFNAAIATTARRAGIDLNDMNRRACTGFAVYVPARHAVYHIQDCSFAFLSGGRFLETHRTELAIDCLLSGLRADFVRQLEALGVNPFPAGRDLGREFILPALCREPELQNIDPADRTPWLHGLPRGHFAYRTLNGLPTRIDVTPLPPGTEEVLLASDGFRSLRPTLAETLALLRQQLAADPHCLSILRSTKGWAEGAFSFDDTSYLRVRVS